MSYPHGLSVDVEDWFQVMNLEQVVPRSQWEGLELRCADSTRRILELLDKHGARATFFFLGWIAERLPELVLEVQAAGHELGSHGYDHRRLEDLGAEGFTADLQRTEDILSAITGSRPELFRASTWSLTSKTLWALPILTDRGYVLDSSIFPVRHPDYGIPQAPSSPSVLESGSGSIVEFPPLTLGLCGRRWPVGGGGYLRLFPLGLLRAGLRQQERLGWPGCVYLHPWEVDPRQPRVAVRGLRRFRHYVGLSRTQDKLGRLLREYPFTGLWEALSQRESWREKLPAFAANGLWG
jgi:polysaccharide deacetylase family protein (PEP-CTERM system associated)